MDSKIYPCLWFDGKAQEAANFYCGVFQDAALISDNGTTVSFRIGALSFLGLNGGPMFKINPSVSFFVFCESVDEAREKWEQLSPDGTVMMALNTYPWSEMYGWCADRYGVNWQIMLTKDEEEQIIPALMFTQDVSGRSEEAMQFYTSIFEHSQIGNISRYLEGQGEMSGQINHARFSLLGSPFIAFDGGNMHKFTFDEGISLVIPCDTQEEIDFYWKKLTDGGQESQCGWLKDKFGFSWQVVPSILGSLMSDPVKGPKVAQAFMKMKKFDIQSLLDVK